MPAPTSRPVLLDLDKTLVNVEDAIDYCGALSELATLVPDSLGRIAADTSWNRCTKPVIALLGALAGRPEWTAAAATVEAREVAGVERSTPMPGLAELTAAIVPSRTAIVTLLGPAATERTIVRHLSWRPAVVVARRPDLRPKPAPDHGSEALRVLGATAAEAVMVGDSEVDEATARAAGISFIGVTNGRSGHRFDPGTTIVRDLVEVATVLGAG